MRFLRTTFCHDRSLLLRSASSSSETTGLLSSWRIGALVLFLSVEAIPPAFAAEISAPVIDVERTVELSGDRRRRLWVAWDQDRTTTSGDAVRISNWRLYGGRSPGDYEKVITSTTQDQRLRRLEPGVWFVMVEAIADDGRTRFSSEMAFLLNRGGGVDWVDLSADPPLDARPKPAVIDLDRTRVVTGDHGTYIRLAWSSLRPPYSFLQR